MTRLHTGPAWLFCPADRPERFAKAAAAADIVILDLEDAVAAEHKASARTALLHTPLDPDRTVVRVNAVDTSEHALDLATLRDTGYHTVMLPKAERYSDIRALAPLDVIGLIETPRGALHVGILAAARNLVGLMWGAEDLTAGLGGRSSRRADGQYRSTPKHVRSSTLIAAKTYGRLALDAVYIDLDDLDGLGAEAADASAQGFDASVCLHPKQTPVVRRAYQPDEAEIDWARRVLASAAEHGTGVFALDGRMIDAPLLRHAEQVLQSSSPTHQES